MYFASFAVWKIYIICKTLLKFNLTKIEPNLGNSFRPSVYLPSLLTLFFALMQAPVEQLLE